MRRSLKLPVELCEGSCKISAGFRLVFSCFAALEKDVRSFSKGFHKLPWHHGFPQRYFKLWNLSHDAVGARPDRQDASGAVCRAALQRCQVRLWRWMLMAQGESEVTAGLTQLYFSAGVGPSRFSICAPGLCAGNCSEARFWVRFCVQKSRPLVRGLPGARFCYVDHFRKKAACGGSLFFKKKFSTLGACLWVRVAVASQSGERRGSKNADLATPKLGPPGGPNFGVAVPAFSCIYTL